MVYKEGTILYHIVYPIYNDQTNSIESRNIYHQSVRKRTSISRMVEMMKRFCVIYIGLVMVDRSKIKPNQTKLISKHKIKYIW